MADSTQVENYSIGDKKEDKIEDVLRITKQLTDSQILFLDTKGKN